MCYIIVDVDDTLIETHSNHKVSLIKNTFLSTPSNVTAMPEVLKFFCERLHQPAVYYLSASPFNLFPYKRAFHNLEDFPKGKIILPSGMRALSFVFSSSQILKYKTARILDLCASEQYLVFFGDSLQFDPEIYGEVYRSYPKWVRAIYIRRVGKPTAAKNDPERFIKAFDQVPINVYRIFDDPRDLIADPLVY